MLLIQCTAPPHFTQLTTVVSKVRHSHLLSSFGLFESTLPHFSPLSLIAPFQILLLAYLLLDLRTHLNRITFFFCALTFK